MKVSKQEGIDLFKALKYNATDAWTTARLEVKLNALPKMVDDSKRQQVEQVSKQLSKLLSEIVTAVGAGDKVSVTTKETVMAKGKNNGKRPSKPVEEEEEDDEEEVDLDEEEEDDDTEDEEDDDASDDDDDSESEDDDDGDDEDAEAESEEEEGDEEDDDADEEEAEEDAEDDESDESEDGDDEDDSDDVDEDDEEEVAEIVAGSIVNHSKYGQCEVLKIKGEGATLKRANKKLVTNVPLDGLELVESDSETDDEEEEEMATATAKKPKSKTPPAKGEKKTPFAGAGGEGKPGVIGTIVELLKGASKAAPISKSQMLVALKKRFKDRDEESMKMTINAQVPNRIKKEKQLNVVREGEGYYIAKGAPKMEEAKPAKAKVEAKAPAAPAGKKPAAKTPAAAAPAAKAPAAKKAAAKK